MIKSTREHFLNGEMPSGISISQSRRKMCFYGWIPAISDFLVKTPFPQVIVPGYTKTDNI